MSDLLSKLTDQLSNQKKPQGGQQPSSSGILHKINDTVTGQKHPQDYQTQTNTNFSGPGSGGMGGGAYQQAGHSGMLRPWPQATYLHLESRLISISFYKVKVEVRANMAKWEVMAETVLAIRIMETKDMGKIKDMVVMDRKSAVVTEDKKATVATEDKKVMRVTNKKAMVVIEDKKATVVTEDKKAMVVMGHKDMVATEDNEDAEAIENRKVKVMPRRFIQTLFIQKRQLLKIASKPCSTSIPYC